MKENQTPITVPSHAFCHLLSCLSFISQYFHSGFACMFRFVSFVFSGVPCERRRPRPRDSSTPRGFTTAPQRQEGQQLPLGTICHGDVPLWPFQRGRLECLCVGRLHVRTLVAPPCFCSGRRNARAKGEARTTPQAHCQEHFQRVGQAVQCSALVRRKHSSVERSREPPDIFGRFLLVASRNASTRSPSRR